MEVAELADHPYYVAVQYHPEYLSRPLSPSPPFLGLILASGGKLNNFLARGCRLSPRDLSDEENSGKSFSLLRESTKLMIIFMNKRTRTAGTRTHAHKGLSTDNMTH